MFRITPINDKEKQKEYAIACNATFCENEFAYVMLDTETNDIMGFSQFDIKENGGYISELKPKIGLSDFEAMFILGRATMNFIDLCGSHKCFAALDAAEERLLRCIGFKLNDENLYFADMQGMFEGHCDHKPIEPDMETN